MTDAEHDSREQRILALTPTSKDAALARAVLQRAGLDCVCCLNLEQVCAQLRVGAAAVLLAEEAIAPDGQNCLTHWLAQQPPWSDLPILVLARPGADSAAVAQAMDRLGNVTVLERPTRVAAFVSAIRSALRARQRQYQLRNHLAERERHLQAQALLANIVASSDDAIISMALDATILTWNAGAEHLFGYSVSEAIGRPVTMLLPPERPGEEPSLLHRLLGGERVEHFETVRMAKDGRRVDVSLTVSLIRDAGGKMVGASKVARDITERKKAEAALREADRRKDEFLAILAHELRNPLAPIRNSLHILRLTASEDPTTQHIGAMLERQVNHLVRLVDDLLEVSRITRGKVELRKEQVEVAAVVRSAVETSEPLLQAAGHQLALTLPSEPLILEGDPVRLAQVLANLLNNAAKFTPPGGQVWLTVRREGDDVVIAVRDTGRGIPQDMLPRVFELFTQGDRAASYAQGGLGIGLALVRSLVGLHGGSVQASSAGAGMGSEFIVRLPVAVDPRPVDRTGQGRTSVALAPRRVLVVDDNRDAAESIAMLLRLIGAEVRVAYSGTAALELLTSYRPAVVLMDIGMPEMDGYEVARRIRQQSEFRDLTLIALTGWGQEEARRRSRMAGFDYHLIKPADVGALETLLMSLESRR